jgi:hypothetical protein
MTSRHPWGRGLRSVGAAGVAAGALAVIAGKPQPAVDEAVLHDALPSFRDRFTPEYRKEVKRWIDDCTETILGRMKAVGQHAHDAARRQAIEAWMLDRHMMERVQPKNVLPQSARHRSQMTAGATPPKLPESPPAGYWNQRGTTYLHVEHIGDRRNNGHNPAQCLTAITMFADNTERR